MSTSSGDVTFNFNANTSQFEGGAGKIRNQMEGIRQKAAQVQATMSKGGGFLGLQPSVLGKTAAGLSQITQQFTGMGGVFFGGGAIGIAISAAIGGIMLLKTHLSNTTEESKKLNAELIKVGMGNAEKSRSVAGIGRRKAEEIVKASDGRIKPEDIATYAPELLEHDKNLSSAQLTTGILALKNLQPGAKGGDKFTVAAMKAGLDPGDLSTFSELSNNQPDKLAEVAQRVGRMKDLDFFGKRNAMAFLSNQVGVGARMNYTMDDAVLSKGGQIFESMKTDIRLNDTAGQMVREREDAAASKGIEATNQVDRAGRLRAKALEAFPLLDGKLKTEELLNLDNNAAFNLIADRAQKSNPSQFKDGKYRELNMGGLLPARVYDRATSTGGQTVLEIVRATYDVIKTKNNYNQDAGVE